MSSAMTRPGSSLDEKNIARLLATHHCTSCHRREQKLVGPSFQSVGKRYAGKADALAQISEHIRQGGKGRWGPIPMPPQPQLSDAELQALSRWVLQQQ